MKLYKQAICMITVLICLIVFPAAATAAEYEGLDVSVWQGTIDFEEVRSAGKEVVYIRAGYGLTEDTRFRTNASGANAAGLDVGYYFFVTATTIEEGEAQARYFASLISDETYNCRPAIDFETFTGLTDSEVNAIALAFAETLESETGHTPLFYTDANNAANLWEDSLTAYPLWVADYGVSAPYSTGPWETWVGFQYSDVGRVSGINGNVDLDLFTDEVFSDDTENRLPFIDVNQNDWYYGAVLSLYNDGLIEGTSSTTFSPEDPVRRATPVVILYRIEGSPAVSGTSGFSDVVSGIWYSDAVTWAAQNNIAEGTGAGMFDPEMEVSRQDAAVFIYRYAVYKGYDTEVRGNLDGFQDSDTVSAWAETAVKWALGAGIIKGVSSDNLAPQDTATRAELAVMISRFMTRYSQ